MDAIDRFLTRHTRAIAALVALWLIAVVGSVALRPV